MPDLSNWCPEAPMALTALREPAHDCAPPRHHLAPNVIALWSEDRPPVANPPRRGRYPRGVVALRRWNRLRPGVYAYLWNNCLPENRGVVVQLLGEPDGCFWNVRGITGLLAQGHDGTAVPSLHREGWAENVNLRRCPAPQGVRHAQSVELAP